MSEDLPKAHAAAWALEPDLEIVGDDVEVATPFLVLDHDKVVKTVAEFTTAFPGVDIHYAVKCNPAIELVRELHRVGCGFEIASISELALLESAGWHRVMCCSATRCGHDLTSQKPIVAAYGDSALIRDPSWSSCRLPRPVPPYTYVWPPGRPPASCRARANLVLIHP
ncbi:hypothetical protein F5544_30625 [Nocardia arthritidis]|uniref:ornithine decarboxylase n=1 Tax=Nocardia arthritidis TaxID=228602 RepID=A0A6G9YL91_9NOCA|nr:hypothetical protein F5544_30625 [Nocardia arthritidis]